jgi:hypothetical protein
MSDWRRLSDDEVGELLLRQATGIIRQIVQQLVADGCTRDEINRAAPAIVEKVEAWRVEQYRWMTARGGSDASN